MTVPSCYHDGRLVRLARERGEPCPLCRAERAAMQWLLKRGQAGPPAASKPMARETAIGAAMVPCPHLGDELPETVACESCGGRTTRLKVFACEVLGKCLPTVSVPGFGFCGRCPFRPK